MDSSIMTSRANLPLNPTTEDVTQQDHIEGLRDALSNNSTTYAFTCGGKLVHASDNAKPPADLQRRLDKTTDSIFTGGVILRYGADGTGNTLELPTPSGQDSKLQKLIDACNPASFGVGGKEVLDDTYRKAIKMDVNDFCTDFCPYNIGIVDIINQLLVPSFNHKRSVYAELYKLNVYSGPSGMFKAHVDTPRSELQVGSLVVCLPSAFKGGKLSVRNGEEEVVFDWAAGSGNSIQWAAFFSDCEHEVHQITEGHRVTLTYNLFLTTRTDLLAGSDMSLHATSHPLGKLFEAAVSDPRFMPKGGRLGVYLTHLYPHTHKTLMNLLPSCLKGVDMAVYETVRVLSLQRSLVHVKSRKEAVTPLTAFEAAGDYDEDEWYGDSDEDDDDDAESDEEARRQLRKLPIARHVTWLNEVQNYECSRAFMAYGNEPSLEVQYVRAALLIKVLPATQRFQDQ